MDLKTYINHCDAVERGAQTRLAVALGCQSQLVYQWKEKVRPVPLLRAIQIDRATAGSVTAEELCPEYAPEIRWLRTRPLLAQRKNRKA